ncbi:MAG: hypothetical protein V1494_04800 [Candidatus Diapherotrites archaeon]
MPPMERIRTALAEGVRRARGAGRIATEKKKRLMDLQKSRRQAASDLNFLKKRLERLKMQSPNWVTYSLGKALVSQFPRGHISKIEAYYRELSPKAFNQVTDKIIKEYEKMMKHPDAKIADKRIEAIILFSKKIVDYAEKNKQLMRLVRRFISKSSPEWQQRMQVRLFTNNQLFHSPGWIIEMIRLSNPAVLEKEVPWELREKISETQQMIEMQERIVKSREKALNGVLESQPHA